MSVRVPDGRCLQPGGLRTFAYLLLPITVHLVLSLAAGPGFMASDDMAYVEAANAVAHGEFELTPRHFENRLGLVYPIGIAFRLFGVDPHVASLWPALWSCAAIATLVLVATRCWGLRTGLVAGMLLAVTSGLVSGSTHVLPDNVVGAQSFIAVALILTARARHTGPRAALCGAAAALVFALAVTTKLSALWAVPFLAGLLALDLARRRGHTALWTAFASTGLLCAVAYLAAYQRATGDALFRLRAIEVSHGVSAWAAYDAGELLRRLTYGPLVLIMENVEFVLLVALALPAVTAAVRRDPDRDTATDAWGAYVVVVLVSFWFGTTSFERYAPVPLIARMLAPLGAPLVLLAVAGTQLRLAGVRQSGGRRAAMSLILCASAVLALTQGRVAAATLLAAASVTVGVATRGVRAATLALVIATLTVYGVLRGGVGETPTQAAERQLAARLDGLIEPPAVILLHRRSIAALRYRSGFAGWGGVELVDWATEQGAAAPGRSVYAYLNAEWNEVPAEILRRTGRGDMVYDVAGARLVRISTP